jgi:drug/metabolite transporter (DMT)-like permease
MAGQAERTIVRVEDRKKIVGIGVRRRRTMGYLFIALTVFFTVYGQLVLKYEINSVPSIPDGLPLIGFLAKFVIFRPLVLSGLLSGLLAAFAWMAALSKFELSYAYPYMSLNFVVVVVLSFILFAEGINAYKLVGLVLICIGVFVVSRGAAEVPQSHAAVSLVAPAATVSASSRPGVSTE